MLIVIVLLAAFLRFYKVDKVPVSLYWDETASAYNAFSIAQTGKDEYGTSFPLMFRSFEDYKMPGSIYLTALSTKIFGLNEFSARFSSGLAGVLTVLVTYFLVIEICKFFPDYLKEKKINPLHLALLSTFLLTISPWHLQFSRTGFEANVGLFFVVFGTCLFLKGLQKQRYYFVAMTIFALSFYFYRSIHIFLPIFLCCLFVIFRNDLFTLIKKRNVYMGIVILVVLSLPILKESFSQNGLRRVNQVSIFTLANSEVYDLVITANQAGYQNLNNIFYNRRYVFFQKIVDNYLAHLGPRFLFIKGDSNGRHGVIGMGLQYIWEIPFLLFGVVMLSNVRSKIKYVIFSWILIAPIASALSIPSPHALRALNMVPPLEILAALGILRIIARISGKKKVIFCLFLLGIIMFFFARYLFLYYIVTSEQRNKDWADGYKQLTTYVFDNENKYDKVIISGYNWQPYIYFLFYKKYDPALFQKYGSKKGFDKYLFGGTSWDKEQYSLSLEGVNLREFGKGKKILVALSPDEYKAQINNINTITEIKDSNGNVVFAIGDIK